MAEYRLYCLDQNGRIWRRHDIEAADDDAAIAVARQEYPDTTSELWCGTRKVTLLPETDELKGRRPAA